MSEQNGYTRKQYNVNVPATTLTLNLRLVSAPEMRYTGQGTAVTSFRGVTSRKFKRGEEWDEKNAFVRVSCWRDLAERVSSMNLQSGDVVQVEFNSADMDVQAYTPKDGGDPRASLEITAGHISWIAKAVERKEAEADADAETIPF